MLPVDEHSHGLNQRQMGEGLRQVPQALPGGGVDLLGIKQQRVAERQQLLAQGVSTPGFANQASALGKTHCGPHYVQLAAQVHAIQLPRFEQIKLTSATRTKGAHAQRIADLANALLTTALEHVWPILDSSKS